MNAWLKLLRITASLLLIGVLLAGASAAGLWWYLAPRLPSIQTLRDVRLQVPLRVLSANGRLIAEYGEKRRSPLRMKQVPRTMTEAVLAAEDDRFYEHPGVDWQGLLRAAWHLVRTGEKAQGGSTITMQVARNFFLGREKTYLRKLNEIILAFQIENGLSKEEILELYLNKIYLGHRAYGVGAAAQVYYGQPIDALSLAQMAMIAGLPKAPSRFNPIADPERAVSRRNYVLRRMRELGFVGQEAYQQALDAPVTARLHGLAAELEAPYAAEMVRAWMVARYGQEAYTSGYTVYTTLMPALQSAANRALRAALLDYDRRHGYRGPERRAEDAARAGPQAWKAALADMDSVGGLRPALVTAVHEKSVSAYSPQTGELAIPWEGLSWARRHVDENRRGPAPQSAADVLAAGDVVRVLPQDEHGWHLSQIPQVEGALVALSPGDGAVLALTGGFDFYRSKFNRAVQARRQPGSNFKPFIYSAALDSGFTPATLINDAPVVFDAPGLEAAWRPENYSGKFFGPTRLRMALTKSRNLVSIRLLRAVGVDAAIDYVRRFGFETERLPRNLSLALGSGTLTPLEVARGYAVFANGGYLTEPYYIARIEGLEGEPLYTAEPARVCAGCEPLAEHAGEAAAPAQQAGPQAGPTTEQAPEPAPRLAPRAITAQNAWLMTSMLRDVVKYGTGRRALSLGRDDLAGKTGTTNDQRDAWFSGYNQSVAATAWVGFDQLSPLGRRETGSRAALPMWIAFMEAALAGVSEQPLERPAGLVTVRIDPDTGELAPAGLADAIFETFRVENVPREAATAKAHTDEEGRLGVTEQLF